VKVNVKSNMIEEKIRLNKFLYQKNICSRREADRLIQEGLILVNGKKAVLGQKVSKKDEIKILDKAKKKLNSKITILFNKPIGVVSHNPQKGEKEVNDFLPFKEKLSPVGRLDKNSHGLMILTNDGKIVDKILNPNNEHEKEYIVKVDKKIKNFFLKKMSQGVDIGNYFTKPAKIKKIDDFSFKIILTEGKKHQIRRMVDALGYQVRDLKRIRIMNFKLGDLKEGK